MAYLFRRPIKWNEAFKITMHSNGCTGSASEILYLEHVQLLLSLDYTRRGDLVVYLTSPMGTKSCLLSPRKEDVSDEGFTKWPFMTTHSWGEDPRGTWTLEIKDVGENRPNHGTLTEWQLILHGTKQKPGHQSITHPDKPRDSVPVPETPGPPSLSTHVPSGPTYTFGPAPSPVKYVSPQVVSYPPSSAGNPAVVSLAAQTAMAQQQKQTNRNFIPNNKVIAQAQNSFNQQPNTASFAAQEHIFSPVHGGFVPPNYIENQLTNLYHFGPPGDPGQEYVQGVNNPAVQQNNDQLSLQQTIGWNEVPSYHNPLQLNSYSNYLRTFGRRGVGRSHLGYLRSKKNKLKRTWTLPVN